jgi:hypothetical protein
MKVEGRFGREMAKWHMVPDSFSLLYVILTG